MAKTSIGSYAPDFELPGADGTVHHLARYLESHRAVCVIFMCNHCPYVKAYLDRIAQLHQDYSPQGVAIIAMNPNDAAQFPEDSFAAMKTFVIEQKISYPYLRDENQDVAHTFDAVKTPHAFLLNQQGVIVYNGAIDDNAKDVSAVQATYLRDAIDSVLAGQTIKIDTTEPVGCSVKWRQQGG
jgi:peroxiredoxin